METEGQQCQQCQQCSPGTRGLAAVHSGDGTATVPEAQFDIRLRVLSVVLASETSHLVEGRRAPDPLKINLEIGVVAALNGCRTAIQEGLFGK